MKIALLTPGGVDRDGESRVIPCLLWLIEELGKDGHEVHVFVPRMEPRAAVWPLCGATVHNAGDVRWHWQMLRAIAKEHRRHRFDVIHAFWIGMAPMGALAGKILRVPLVVTLPGGDPICLSDIGFGGRSTMRGRVQWRVAAACARQVTVPSNYMLGLAADAGIEASTIALGASKDHWPTSPPRRRGLDRPLRLLHVASLNRVKDQPTLLNSLALLRARGTPFNLRVVGIDTLAGEIHALARSLDLGPHVEFAGLVPHSRLRPEYENADLLVMASRHEAGPLVMLEAALCGVPTVGTRVGHIADQAPHAALAVPICDPAALADGIEMLANDEGHRLRLAWAAQAFAAQNDAASTARAFEAVYRGVANG